MNYQHTAEAAFLAGPKPFHKYAKTMGYVHLFGRKIVLYSVHNCNQENLCLLIIDSLRQTRDQCIFVTLPNWQFMYLCRLHDNEYSSCVKSIRI